MPKTKYLQLIHHLSPFEHYTLREALIEEDESFPYWVGSKPIKTFDSYHIAVEEWGLKEPYYSGVLDILCEEDVEFLYNKVEYEDEQEIIF
jgi:hypothetical protein